MKIGLDVRMLGFSGIGTTIRGFLDHLTPSQFNSLILFGLPVSPRLYPCPLVQVPYPVYSLRQHWGYASQLKQSKLDLFHMPHFDVPFFYDRPFVVTIHDLIHLLFPQYSTKPLARWYAQVMIHHVVKRAKKIIVVSENTRKDLIKLYPEAENKSTVIHPGIDNNLKPVPIEQSRECLVRLGIKKDYLLYVGNLRGIKNTSRLLKAYSLLRKKRRECPDLVLVGRNFFKKSELFPPGVFHLGEVKREDLASLYSRALLFVFPSFYEGFGLPPLEAMACGTPVVTSKVASLPEVCGDAAEYVDPYSEQSIIHGIETLLDSSSRRDSLRKMGFENVKRFDNKKFAREIWKIYEEASA